jgi:DNA adenine methylase
VPRLRELWFVSGAKRLVEPFCGGLSVALGLDPDRAHLNDINPHSINFCRWLQRGFRIRIPMRNESELYYRHRDEFNRLIAGRGRSSHKAAELFYYLNRTGYNGLCRFNRKGVFNVPFGRYTRISYRRDFGEYRAPLSRWTFGHGDFAEIELERDDFVYADPPYDVQFRQYADQGFDWPQQIRLAYWLAEHPGPVVLSNQATDRIIELYRQVGFELHCLDAPRMINSTGDRSPAREVLAIRNLPRRPTGGLLPSSVRSGRAR